MITMAQDTAPSVAKCKDTPGWEIQAREHMRNGRYQRALACYLRALFATPIEKPQKKARIALDAATTCEHLSDIDAYRYLEQASQLIKRAFGFTPKSGVVRYRARLVKENADALKNDGLTQIHERLARLRAYANLVEVLADDRSEILQTIQNELIDIILLCGEESNERTREIEQVLRDVCPELEKMLSYQSYRWQCVLQAWELILFLAEQCKNTEGLVHSAMRRWPYSRTMTSEWLAIIDGRIADFGTADAMVTALLKSKTDRETIARQAKLIAGFQISRLKRQEHENIARIRRWCRELEKRGLREASDFIERKLRERIPCRLPKPPPKPKRT